MPVITAAQARKAIHSVLAARGVPRPAAALQADHLVEGDLRGHSSHGIQRLPVIARRLDAGLTNPTAVPVAIDHTPATFTIDGDRALGPVAAATALEEASLRATTHGVAVAALRDCGHLGMLAPYVESMARRGFIAIAMSISEALVHPIGGRRAMLGTNPIAFGVPGEPNPFVFDMATSAMSMGELLHLRATGEPLKSGMAVDSAGDPTTDPAAAAEGALSPFGGYKGFGLGLAIELIVPLLSGSAIGRDVSGTLDTQHECNKGDVFILISPDRFGRGRTHPVGEYLAEVAADIAPSGYATPGARSLQLRADRLVHGYAVADDLWDTDIPALLKEVLT